MIRKPEPIIIAICWDFQANNPYPSHTIPTYPNHPVVHFVSLRSHWRPDEEDRALPDGLPKNGTPVPDRGVQQAEEAGAPCGRVGCFGAAWILDDFWQLVDGGWCWWWLEVWSFFSSVFLWQFWLCPLENHTSIVWYLTWHCLVACLAKDNIMNIGSSYVIGKVCLWRMFGLRSSERVRKIIMDAASIHQHRNGSDRSSLGCGSAPWRCAQHRVPWFGADLQCYSTTVNPGARMLSNPSVHSKWF